MFNKRRISFLMLCVMLLVVFTGCGKTEVADNQKGDKKYSVVCTIFPEYDWVCQILGDSRDKFDITLLLDNGVDLHSYQPTAEDIAKISACDLFVYVGGESDKWVEDALKEASNPDMQVINLIETLGAGVKEEELVEGMEDEAEEHGDGAEDEEEAEYDEHVWLSLKNACILVEEIAEKLGQTDIENADLYKANCTAYKEKLVALDEEYKSTIDLAKYKTILFGDRFPFRYLVDDYGLDYYAAFAGCSAETEASFDTIIFLAGKVDELGLKSIMIIDGSDDKLAKTIVDNTSGKNQQILALDSMQSTTMKDINDGKNYILAMESNLEVLKQALN